MTRKRWKISPVIKLLSTLFLISFSIFSYCQSVVSPKVAKDKPFILGVIDEIQSTELAEKRILNIYLPEVYNKNDTTKYPVVYLLDGSADEDFIHIVGLYQFNSFEWINRVPKSIIVGIATVDRRRDFTYPTTIEADKKRYPTTGHSDKFINFIQKELQPYIEKKYRTTPSKTIIGESLGGLLATEVLLKRPTLFNKYIIVSPSLWWDNGSLLTMKSAMLLPTFNSKTDVYIGVGKEGLVPGDNPRVMEVDANLLAEKIKSTKSKSVNVYFDYLPQEDHATIMHQAVFNALRFLNPITNNK
jgi:uncharacterized protein